MAPAGRTRGIESGAFAGLVAGLLAAAPVAGEPTLAFTDVSGNSGADFVHRNGASGTKYAVELIGAGGALLDFDGDGDLDLYLVQGAGLPGNEYAGAPPANTLYENVGWSSLPGSGAAAGGPAFRPPFLRVRDAAGAADTSYGMGAAAADFDNDGDPDLYVTNFGANRLYRNDAGRFTDVTEAAGVGDPRWSTSAAWVDVDDDGLLDLYVCNYFRYRIEEHEWYGIRKEGYRTHGGPASFKPDYDVLYRNRGDGTFEDVSERAGIMIEPNFALGVVAGDFDGDADTDIYVANDTQANWFFLNDGSGRFREDGMIAGVAYDHAGKPQAGMGVDAADTNGDGFIDLFCTNFSLETNTLYRGEGGGFFYDASYEAGLGEAAHPYLAFGAGFFDLENDRDLDLFVANGHIMDNVPLYFDNLTYKEPNQLFVNTGSGLYEEADESWGSVTTQVEASRAAIFGDLDNDGDTDLIVTNVAARPQIIRNDGGNKGGWVRVLLSGRKSNRDGFGADVRVTVAESARRFQARAALSYLSSNDPRILAGLGDAAAADVEVRWPSGTIDRVENVPARHAVLIVEGEGGKILPTGLTHLGYAMEEEF